MAFSPNTIITDPNIVNCSFTIPSSTVTAPAVYSTSNAYYLITASIITSTTLVAAGPSTPPATGTLTLVTGTGPATIAYTAVSSSSNIPETANVKIPGATPTAADMAAVVALSPNGNQATAAIQNTQTTILNTIATNTGTASTDTTNTGTITTLNGAVMVNAQGAYTVSASITGTFVATLVARGQLADNTWVIIPMYVVTGSVPYAVEFSTTTPQTVLIVGGGYLNIEIYSTAYTSGTVNVALDASLAQQLNVVAQLGNWTVTSIQGTANTAANAWPTKITDGTNIGGIAAASTAAVATQPAQVVALSPNTALPTGSNIIGALVANQSINLAQIAGSTASTATTGVLKVGIVGNAGAAFDQAPASAAPANAIQVGGSDGTNMRALSMQAKNTQGTYAASVQNQYDTGRNHTNYFMVNQVVTTASDALMSLTGYKGGAAVAATTTPVVVTTGKTYRVTSITITYVAITTAGTARFTLRANTGGVVAIGSAAVQTWIIGGPSTTAGVTQIVSIPIPEGMEFAAGTGIGVSMIGYGATGTAAAVGYGQIAINGYEY